MRNLQLYENRESHITSYIEKSGFCEKTGCIRKPILTGFFSACYLQGFMTVLCSNQGCVQINLIDGPEYIRLCHQFNQRIIWKQKIKQQ